MLNGKEEEQGFNSKKNELVSQEVLILKEIGFDMDGFPSFFDVIEIFMAAYCLRATSTFLALFKMKDASI